MFKTISNHYASKNVKGRNTPFWHTVGNSVPKAQEIVFQ